MDGDVTGTEKRRGFFSFAIDSHISFIPELAEIFAWLWLKKAAVGVTNSGCPEEPPL